LAIGIDGNTGDITPFYDHAASFLFLAESESMLYDEKTGTRVPQLKVPDYLRNKFGIQFYKHGSVFYEMCMSLDPYELLAPLRSVMGRHKHEDFEEGLYNQITERLHILRDELIKFKEE
jgi:hypothetical protein